MLHDQFGKFALTEMLISAIYWETFDRTPWASFVPDRYFEAALKEVLDPAFDRIPENWDPLPIDPRPRSPSNHGGSPFQLSSSDEEEDDPKARQDFPQQSCCSVWFCSHSGSTIGIQRQASAWFFHLDWDRQGFEVLSSSFCWSSCAG
ncbi:hypothetical protein PF003_g18415 [Phytophthora fragariae]|nr:hypothetical protein PF003_g18415 [Phytophthora fragariae]